ncbi:MAG: AhpC/TSA family protein [Phycisphaerales bacterium]|nr:AhpC/TSA family protein [Phycisphaerales bacterium]
MRYKALAIGTLVTPALLLSACATSHDTKAPTAAAAPPADPTASEPGLHVGDRAPDATVYTQDGKAVSLKSLYADAPLVVTFYRGGWCPFCNRALDKWQTKLDELHAAGGQLVALTPESPDHAAETIDKHDLGYSVYSDSSMQAAKAYKVLFEVDPDTQAKYKGFGIDLASWNSSGQWTLPAPGTFVIDKHGVIQYAWADWDYKKRADPDEVIAAVRAAR